MARRKEISKQKILETAYKIAIRDGIEALTARNIAKAVHCSTQPIYLEFSNMADLRCHVLTKISTELKAKALQQHYTGEPLIDLDLSYISFAKNHIGLFKAMFIDGKFGNKLIINTLITLGREKFEEQYDDHKFDAAHLKHIVLANWISATGIAALLVNDVACFSQSQIVNILKAQIHDAMTTDRLEQTEQNPMFAMETDETFTNKLAY